MLVEEHGVSPVDAQPIAAGWYTFTAFVVCGAIPLIPFVFQWQHGFAIAVIIMLSLFAAIGALKSRWSLKPWWHSTLETMGVGAVAALIAYLSAAFVSTLIG